MDDFKTTDEVAQMCDCQRQIVQRWAQKNNVHYIGKDNRKQYLFTKEDIINFRNRTKPGRPWPKK